MVETLLKELVAAAPEQAPVRVRSFDGLTVDFARSIKATALLRGVRNLSDLQYEVQQAVTNREVADLETAFVVAGQTFAYTSSSLIKQSPPWAKTSQPSPPWSPRWSSTASKPKKPPNTPSSNASAPTTTRVPKAENEPDAPARPSPPPHPEPRPSGSGRLRQPAAPIPAHIPGAVVS